MIRPAVILQRTLIQCALACLAAAPAAAQMPDTDIFLAELRIAGDHIEIGTPRNITNRPGYDNQPWFLRDGSALLYNADMGGQTDVFRYDLATATSTRLTDTPVNEFSPSLTADGSEMLIVRWEADMSDGHLWRYSPDGVPIGVHAADVPRVGYYGVMNENLIVAFVNDSARTFVMADARTGERRRVGERLGGSPPQRIPRAAAMSFVQQDSAGDMWIMRADSVTDDMTPIAPAVEGSVSYAWTDDGVLLMPRGNAIYALDPARETEWRQVARFDSIGTIARIAINAANDRIALVVGN
jgi:hypothetical protein